jgi:hypothetical protein
MTFPYPGDDPSALDQVSSDIDSAHTNMKTFGTGLGQIKGQLSGAWQSDASDKAQGDMTTLTSMTTTISTDLNSAKSAVDDLAAALRPIRTSIDDLRSTYATQASILQGEQDQYGRAARFGEANDMTPAELAQYRTVIAGQETKTRANLTGLESEYEALVRKANAATATCTAALGKASSGQSYQGGSSLSTVPLSQALGIGNLAILHQQQMQVLAKKYADELANVNSTDSKGAAAYHKVAQEIAQYQDDPDFAATFYGELGSQRLQSIPNFLYASGSSTAGDDLRTFSHVFGTAVSNQGADSRMAAVANSFLNTPREPEMAWSRAALSSFGTFPSDWLAKAARYNVLDDFAKNGDQGFGGFGYKGVANGDRLPYDLDLPDDAVGAWTTALSHNPDAARYALATMGSDNPNDLTEPLGGDSWKSYSDNIHKLIDYGQGMNVSDAKANGLLFAAAAGADDETDGSHSGEASTFARALFTDLSSGNGDNGRTQPSATDSYAKIAGSYVEELAAGANISGNNVGTDHMTMFTGQNAAFGVSPDATKELMHTFVGSAESTKIFDDAAGAAAHQAMVAGARLDATTPAADESHFNDVSEAYGSVAGAENQATTDVVGDADESAARSAELTKSILSAGIDLIPGEKIAEKVPGTLWDIGKHMANVGLEHAYGETDDPRFDALQDTSHSVALVSAYDKLAILQEAGYPGTDSIPSDLLDPNTHQLLSPDKILGNEDLQQTFHDYLVGGPASTSDGRHVSVYEATQNAGGRYQLGFDRENGDH